MNYLLSLQNKLIQQLSFVLFICHQRRVLSYHEDTIYFNFILCLYQFIIIIHAFFLFFLHFSIIDTLGTEYIYFFALCSTLYKKSDKLQIYYL